jgi:hypothetical protein
MSSLAPPYKSKWHCITEKVPADQEIVVLRIFDQFHVATFDAANRCFILKSGECYPMDTTGALWMTVSSKN